MRTGSRGTGSRAPRRLSAAPARTHGIVPSREGTALPAAPIDPDVRARWRAGAIRGRGIGRGGWIRRCDTWTGRRGQSWIPGLATAQVLGGHSLDETVADRVDRGLRAVG